MEQFLSNLIEKIEYLGDCLHRKSLCFESEAKTDANKDKLCKNILDLLDKIKRNCSYFEDQLLEEATKYRIQLGHLSSSCCHNCSSTHQERKIPEPFEYTLNLCNIIGKEAIEHITDAEVEKFKTEVDLFATRYWATGKKLGPEDNIEKQLNEIFGSDSEHVDEPINRDTTNRLGEIDREAKRQNNELLQNKEYDVTLQLEGSQSLESSVSIDTILRAVDKHILQKLSDEASISSQNGTREEILSRDLSGKPINSIQEGSTNIQIHNGKVLLPVAEAEKILGNDEVSAKNDSPSSNDGKHIEPLRNGETAEENTHHLIFNTAQTEQQNAEENLCERVVLPKKSSEKYRNTEILNQDDFHSLEIGNMKESLQVEAAVEPLNIDHITHDNMEVKSLEQPSSVSEVGKTSGSNESLFCKANGEEVTLQKRTVMTTAILSPDGIHVKNNVEQQKRDSHEKDIITASNEDLVSPQNETEKEVLIPGTEPREILQNNKVLDENDSLSLEEGNGIEPLQNGETREESTHHMIPNTTQTEQHNAEKLCEAVELAKKLRHTKISNQDVSHSSEVGNTKEVLDVEAAVEAVNVDITTHDIKEMESSEQLSSVTTASRSLEKEEEVETLALNDDNEEEEEVKTSVPSPDGIQVSNNLEQQKQDTPDKDKINVKQISRDSNEDDIKACQKNEKEVQSEEPEKDGTEASSGMEATKIVCLNSKERNSINTRGLERSDNYDATNNVRKELLDVMSEVACVEGEEDEVTSRETDDDVSDSSSSRPITSKTVKEALAYLMESFSSGEESIEVSGYDNLLLSGSDEELESNLFGKRERKKHITETYSKEESKPAGETLANNFCTRKCSVIVERVDLEKVRKSICEKDSANEEKPLNSQNIISNNDSIEPPRDKMNFELKECFVKLEPLKLLEDSSDSDMDSPSNEDEEDKEIERLCNLSSLVTKRKRTSTDESPTDKKEKRKRLKRKRKISLSGSETSDLTGFDSVSEDDIKKEFWAEPEDQNFHTALDPNALLTEILCHTIHDSDSESDSSEIPNEVKPSKSASKKKKKFDNEERDDKQKDKDSWRNDPLLTSNLNLPSTSTTDRKVEPKKRKRLNSSSSNNSSSSEQRVRRFRRIRIKETYSESDSSDSSEEDYKNITLNKTVQDRSKSDYDSDVEFVDSTKISPAKSKSSVINVDSDEEVDKKPGRRNILSVLSGEGLTQETQRAARKEKERLIQLEKKKEKMNSQQLLSQENSEEGIVLDSSLDGYKVTVDPALSKRLFPHQVEGVQFMWDTCYLSVDDLKTFKGTGCILAHNMGLGKTFQVVTLVHTIFSHSVTNTKHVLIVCPLSTVSGWKKEFQTGLKIATTKTQINIIQMESSYDMDTKFGKVNKWKEKGGVLIVGYEALAKLTKNEDTLRSKLLRKALVDPGPDLVVCDEGHLLKNGKAQRTKALMEIKTKRRIALTGTPLQNNLIEYYFMVQFVKPNLLGTKHEFNRQFGNPIMNGQYEDSVEADIKLMKKRTHVLHRILKNTVQRYEPTELKKYLPTMKDYALFIQLHPIQESLYRTYIELARYEPNEKSKKKMKKFFSDYQLLKYICSHPQLLHTLEAQNAQGKKKVIKETDVIDEQPEVQEVDGIPNGWWNSLCPEDVKTNIEFGTKLQVMMGIIEEAEKVGDKVLIFTSSLVELSSIEYFLKLKGTAQCPSWRSERDYFRMDGTVSPSMRTRMCELFNDETKKVLRLFLMSHKVGGLGLNLVAANRVILLGTNFNPSLDTQSIFRAYRFGQNKPVCIYRLISMGTMEEKIYHRCVTKLAIASRVVDKHQIARHYKNLDLEDLYTVSIDLSQERPTPSMPDDELLANILLKFDCIHKFHQHQKLLENQPDEDLNEEDKITAWEEFKQMNEKPPVPENKQLPVLPPQYSTVTDLMAMRWNQLNQIPPPPPDPRANVNNTENQPSVPTNLLWNPIYNVPQMSAMNNSMQVPNTPLQTTTNKINAISQSVQKNKPNNGKHQNGSIPNQNSKSKRSSSEIGPNPYVFQKAETRKENLANIAKIPFRKNSSNDFQKSSLNVVRSKSSRKDPVPQVIELEENGENSDDDIILIDSPEKKTSSSIESCLTKENSAEAVKKVIEKLAENRVSVISHRKQSPQDENTAMNDSCVIEIL